MLRRLRHLGYVDGGNLLLPKGRVACCIEGADELLATELLVGGGLNGLSVPELAAVASCLLQADRPGAPPPTDSDTRSVDVEAPPAVRGSTALVRAVRALWDARAALAHGSATEAGEAVVAAAGGGGGALRVELMAAVHVWADGKSFAEAWALCGGEVFEGELVRSLRQLDELLRQLAKVAQHVERAELTVLVALPLTVLTSWGCGSSILASLRTRDEPLSHSGPSGRFRWRPCGPPEPPIAAHHCAVQHLGGARPGRPGARATLRGVCGRDTPRRPVCELALRVTIGPRPNKQKSNNVATLIARSKA